LADGASSEERERWNRIKALFLDALERPASERSAFVRRAAVGDEGLRQEVESLLASEAAAVDFAEVPAAALLGGLVLPEPEAARLPPGTQLGPYEIDEFVAAGGMGAVYRARHRVLGREVAIKTVNSGLGDDGARRRLIREARHAAVLSHPHICAVYDVGEAGGVPFIAMEFVHGRTLTAILRQAVPPLREALDYGVQITEALQHAHDHGIVHRDLKSSNVIIDAEGRAIVLDFGLARRVPTADGPPSHEQTITIPDALAGTLSHMAPEVLRGERADARSDVWSLGVLLYELLTGELPFTGRTPFETSSAILGESPRSMRGRVPLGLRLVVERCLRKDPTERYQRAADVGAALEAIRRRRAWPLVGRLLVAARQRTIAASAVTGLVVLALILGRNSLNDALRARFARSVPTVAVLPLENATGDPQAAYYAEGIAEALIWQLGAASEARVLSRASTRRVAATTRAVKEVAAQLGADVVVEGVLRRATDRIEIDVSLVRPADGRVLWSDSYARDARDVLALEADIVRAIAVAVQLTLRPGVRERLAAVRAVSPDVYEAYLKGRYEWNKRTPESLRAAIAHFTRATELDPTYAPAHAALADCFNQLGTQMVGTGSPREFRPRAAAEAIKALQIDPLSAEAHAALGYVWHYEWRWADAEREFRRAIELNPNYALARIWYANFLMSRLRMKEALEQVAVGRELDPLSLVVNTNVGWILTVAGRPLDAIAQLRQTLALDSTYLQARWRLAIALTYAGRYTEALDQARRLVAASDTAPPALALLANVYAHAGMRDSARVVLDALLARRTRRYVPTGSIAGVFAVLGDVPQTMTWLERAFDERSNLIAYLGSDPDYVALRGDPRFEALLTRAGLK
jgi:serine/threonine-protein kinase